MKIFKKYDFLINSKTAKSKNIGPSVINRYDSDGGYFCGSINENKKINVTEKKVLLEMLSKPGVTFSREEIGEISGISQERSIDVMITRLRQKIERNPKKPKFLQTIRGEGYVLWVE